MPTWGVVAFVGMNILQPFVIAVAVREIYRRVPLTDRGLAAVCAVIFSVYFNAIIFLPLALVAPPIVDLLLWAAIGSAGTFVVVFPLTAAMMPSMKHLFRNVPRAERK